MVAYLFVIVALLRKVSLWNPSLLKGALIWFVFSGVALGSNSVEINREFKIHKLVGDNLRVAVIIEYLVNFYTFPLIIEVFTVPIITVIMVGSIVASNNEKLSSGYNLFEWLSVLIGMVVLSFVGLQILQNYRSFASIQTLIGFLLPLILSLCFIPFMYLAALYSHYEDVFNRLR